MTVTIKRNKITSIEEFEKRFEKRASSNSGVKWPTRLGKDGRNFFSVRFLTEPNEWVNYEQYYDPAIKRYVVATEENEDSYSERNIKPSIIHLAAAVDVATSEVIVLELKWTLVKEVNALRTKYAEKGKSLSDFDIELERRGEGKETEYRASYDGSSDVDVSRYEIPGDYKSWQDYLWDVVELVSGNDKDDSDGVDDEIYDDTE